MKLQVEDRIKKRNLMQEKLALRLEKQQRRRTFLEDYLRDQELAMTTPRSLVRRVVCRKVHIAMKRQADNMIVCEAIQFF